MAEGERPLASAIVTPPAFLHPFCPPTRESFTRIVRGAGAKVWDDAGVEYVDGMASLWYAQIGYGNERVADAVARQSRELSAFQCFEPFTVAGADELCERLTALAPVPGGRVFLTNSGSEAVDTAMKLARIAQVRAGRPERTLIVSRGRGYHGTNYGGMTAQGLPLNREGFGPFVEGVVNLPADDLEAMASFLAQHGHEVAAVLSEPVQGAAGVYPPPEGYVEGLRRLCTQHGCLLILDEVITGFGRLGTWFGSHRFGVEPDLLCFAKGVTSGTVPLGGVVVGRAVLDPLEAEAGWMLRHGYTYSGHPLACAAALANLDVLADDGLLARAPVIGAQLEEGLQALYADGSVAEVRGMGAMWGVKLPEGRTAAGVRDAMLGRGAITRAIGTDTVTFCPPLVTTPDEVAHLIDALAASVR